MINDLKIEEQKYADDYSNWDQYYNWALMCFYVQRLSKQCHRFKVPNACFNINPYALLTDKFVLTDSSNRATITRNIKDTHWVEDTYYRISRYIYNNPNEDKGSMVQYLLNTNRCIPKAFAMSYLVGAIEATEVEELQRCVNKIKTINWQDAMHKRWETQPGEGKLKVFGLDE